MFLEVTTSHLDTALTEKLWRSHHSLPLTSQQLEHLQEPTSPTHPPPDLLAAGVPGATPPSSPHSLEGGARDGEGRGQQVAGVGGGEG